MFPRSVHIFHGDMFIFGGEIPIFLGQLLDVSSPPGESRIAQEACRHHPPVTATSECGTENSSKLRPWERFGTGVAGGLTKKYQEISGFNTWFHQIGIQLGSFVGSPWITNMIWLWDEPNWMLPLNSKNHKFRWPSTNVSHICQVIYIYSILKKIHLPLFDMILSYLFGGCYSAYLVDSQASKTGVTWALGQGNKTDELRN